MKKIYWIKAPIPGRLGTMVKPRGGEMLEMDIQDLHQAQVDVVVSLLTDLEAERFGLTEEGFYCQNQSINFVSFPIRVFDVPTSVEAMGKLVEQLGDYLNQDKSIAIHCQMGIGRSSLLAASILTTYDTPVDEAFSLIERYRGVSVPDTQEQREWVQLFAALK